MLEFDERGGKGMIRWHAKPAPPTGDLLSPGRLFSLPPSLLCLLVLLPQMFWIKCVAFLSRQLLLPDLPSTLPIAVSLDLQLRNFFPGFTGLFLLDFSF